jgi:hypothetical protein
MRRRSWLAGAAGLPFALLSAAPARALPPEGYRFRVVREGRSIGSHTVRAEADGSVRNVVALEVKLLSFTVFRMHHEYAERWQNDRLVGFASRTLRDGQEGRLQLAATADGLRGTGPAGPVALPAGMAPLSWWEPSHLARPLFDTATGEKLSDPALRDRNGAITRWQWKPRSMVALYDASGTWIGFTMRGDDGSEIRYEPA